VTDRRLHELRGLVREGKLPEDLVAELRYVVRKLVRLRLLPPVFAPYGQWNDEAADEVFSSWYTERLLRRGHLQLLLDRSSTVGAFRRIAEQSLRQYLLNTSDRSQARNLFGRLVKMLEADDDFVLVRDANRPQDRWWRLVTATDATEWMSQDERLLSEAWALGEFVVIRYRASAKKLSPVLEAGELKRFLVGLLGRVGSALTPRLIMRVLEQRFDLGEISHEELEAETEDLKVTSDVADELAFAEIARLIIAQLTPRQLDVLRCTDAGETIDAMASALGCSVGTIVNEQKRVGDAIMRMSETGAERDALLKIVRDLVYETR
jgi:hypothetical protein